MHLGFRVSFASSCWDGVVLGRTVYFHVLCEVVVLHGSCSLPSEREVSVRIHWGMRGRDAPSQPAAQHCH